MKNIYEVLAKFYNKLPERLRIFIFNTSSATIATLLTLFANNLLSLKITNEYLLVIIGFFAGIINEIQKEIVDNGTKSLVQKGDGTTIMQLHTKIEKTRKLIS